MKPTRFHKIHKTLKKHRLRFEHIAVIWNIRKKTEYELGREIAERAFGIPMEKYDHEYMTLMQKDYAPQRGGGRNDAVIKKDGILTQNPSYQESKGVTLALKNITSLHDKWVDRSATLPISHIDSLTPTKALHSPAHKNAKGAPEIEIKLVSKPYKNCTMHCGTHGYTSEFRSKHHLADHNPLIEIAHERSTVVHVNGQCTLPPTSVEVRLGKVYAAVDIPKGAIVGDLAGTFLHTDVFHDMVDRAKVRQIDGANASYLTQLRQITVMELPGHGPLKFIADGMRTHGKCNDSPTDQIPHDQNDRIPHDQILHNQIPHNQIPHNQIPHNQIPNAIRWSTKKTNAQGVLSAVPCTAPNPCGVRFPRWSLVVTHHISKGEELIALHDGKAGFWNSQGIPRRSKWESIFAPSNPRSRLSFRQLWGLKPDTKHKASTMFHPLGDLLLVKLKNQEWVDTTSLGSTVSTHETVKKQCYSWGKSGVIEWENEDVWGNVRLVNQNQSIK
jgi:hypothetical protein